MRKRRRMGVVNRRFVFDYEMQCLDARVIHDGHRPYQWEQLQSKCRRGKGPRTTGSGPCRRPAARDDYKGRRDICNGRVQRVHGYWPCTFFNKSHLLRNKVYLRPSTSCRSTRALKPGQGLRGIGIATAQATHGTVDGPMACRGSFQPRDRPRRRAPHVEWKESCSQEPRGLSEILQALRVMENRCGTTGTCLYASELRMVTSALSPGRSSRVWMDTIRRSS